MPWRRSLNEIPWPGTAGAVSPAPPPRPVPRPLLKLSRGSSASPDHGPDAVPAPPQFLRGSSAGRKCKPATRAGPTSVPRRARICHKYRVCGWAKRRAPSALLGRELRDGLRAQLRGGWRREIPRKSPLGIP
eukprot:gene16475-biopygen12301